MRKKQNKSNTLGFQPDVKVVGISDTDKEMKERLEKHQNEIDEFFKKNPSIRKTKDY